MLENIRCCIKHYIWILLCLLVINLPIYGAPHLVLYFDINKTLIASDKLGGKSIDNVLNELLAKHYSACWNQSIAEPITFETYVQKVLCEESGAAEEKLAKIRFYLYHFIDFLQAIDHPLYASAMETYRLASEALKRSPGAIFPSFYALLNDLDQQNISYSIILRSYGEEVFDLKNEIEAVQHTTFKGTGKFREGKLYLEGEPVEAEALYEVLHKSGHLAIQDDWAYWNVHGMQAEYGKPFFLDREDSERLSIFFDDHIVEKDAQINIIAPFDALTGALIPIEQLVEEGRAVRVDTLQAILDQDYFINLVKKALKIYPPTQACEPSYILRHPAEST